MVVEVEDIEAESPYIGADQVKASQDMSSLGSRWKVGQIL